MNTPRKQYIAPGEVRKINGVEARAKKVFSGMDEVRCPCTLCIVEKQGICFDPETKNSLPTRPACFGNDPENLSKKSLYYVRI